VYVSRCVINPPPYRLLEGVQVLPDVHRIKPVPIPVHPFDVVAHRERTSDIATQEVLISEHCGTLLIGKEIR
jgi:hypothetical protein